MKIPAGADIPNEKLTRYLLIWKERNDKSKFLAQAGFTHNNPEALKAAIARLTEMTEAVEDGRNDYGVFYRVEGRLQGNMEQDLAVILVWIRWYVDGSFHFVTLKPRKESRHES